MTIEEIKQNNARAGYHWFASDTMRFFSSRVLPKVYAGRFFITSEDSGIEGYPRSYSIRMARDSGEIATVGEFNTYPTKEAALSALKAALNGRSYVVYTGEKPGHPETHFYWQARIGELPVDVRRAKADAEAICAEIEGGRE